MAANDIVSAQHKWQIRVYG